MHTPRERHPQIFNIQCSLYTLVTLILTQNSHIVLVTQVSHPNPKERRICPRPKASLCKIRRGNGNQTVVL